MHEILFRGDNMGRWFTKSVVCSCGCTVYLEQGGQGGVMSAGRGWQVNRWAK